MLDIIISLLDRFKETESIQLTVENNLVPRALQQMTDLKRQEIQSTGSLDSRKLRYSTRNSKVILENAKIEENSTRKVERYNIVVILETIHDNYEEFCDYIEEKVLQYNSSH